MKAKEREALVALLQQRFGTHAQRHDGIAWAYVAARLGADAAALPALAAMEAPGGEPDVIGRDAATGRFVFCDCSAESPAGRRSLCCDRRYGQVFTYHNGVQSYYAARGFRALVKA